MDRRIRMTALAFMLALSLSGCGRNAETEAYESSNVAEIKKDGVITNTITDSFESEYYDKELLEEFTLREAAEYNHENGEDAISIKKLDVKKEEVTLTMEYRTAEDFERFNDYPFFCGTVEEAFAAGYDFANVWLAEAGADTKADADQKQAMLGAEQLREMGSRKILIVTLPEDERLTVKTSGKILYMSGAEYEKKNLAAIDGSLETTAYIVFK